MNFLVVSLIKRLKLDPKSADAKKVAKSLPKMLEATHVSEGERNCLTQKKVGARDSEKWCARDRLSLYKVIYI